MKIYHDPKFKYFLVFLIVLNIIYLKLSKDQKAESIRQIENANMTLSQPIQMIELQPGELEVDDENILEENDENNLDENDIELRKRKRKKKEKSKLYY